MIMRKNIFKAFILSLILLTTISCEKETVNEASKNKIILACGGNDDAYLYAVDGNGDLVWKKLGYSYPAAIKDDIAYITLAGKMYAVDVLTGEEIWANETLPELIFNALALYNDVIYATSTSRDVYAVNASTGELKWTFQTESNAVIGSAPTVVNDIIYFGAPDDYIYAIDLDGNLIWRFHTNSGDLRSSPAVFDNKVFIGSDVGLLYALNAENGDSIWSRNVGMTGEECPTISDNKVYIQGEQALYCLSVVDGSIIWDYTIAYNDNWSSPMEVNGVLYVIGIHEGIQAFNSSDGSRIWENTSFGTETIASPVVYDNVVYISAPGGLIATNASTGKTLWIYGERTFGSEQIKFYTSPVVYDISEKVTTYPSDSGNKQ